MKSNLVAQKYVCGHREFNNEIHNYLLVVTSYQGFVSPTHPPPQVTKVT